MEPIISPWAFYYIDIIDKVYVAIQPLILIILLVIAMITVNQFAGFDEYGTVLKWRKPLCIIFVILCAIYIFIPSKTTIYQMIAASYITSANLEKVGNVNKLIDTVVEEINKSKSK